MFFPHKKKKRSQRAAESVYEYFIFYLLIVERKTQNLLSQSNWPILLKVPGFIDFFVTPHSFHSGIQSLTPATITAHVHTNSPYTNHCTRVVCFSHVSYTRVHTRRNFLWQVCASRCGSLPFREAVICLLLIAIHSGVESGFEGGVAFIVWSHRMTCG